MTQRCPHCDTGTIRITHRQNVYQCDGCRVGYVRPASAPNRIGCLVPFCRANRGDRKGDPITENMEWMCSRHWNLVPPLLRRRKAKLFRLYSRRFGTNGYWVYTAGSPERLAAVKLNRLCATAWERCKRAAIEAAGGIA